MILRKVASSHELRLRTAQEVGARTRTSSHVDWEKAFVHRGPGGELGLNRI